MTPYEVAETQMGMKEIAGSEHCKAILDYHASTTLKATTDETPWCSAFVNWCVIKAGYKGTNSASARSWLAWGKVLDAPEPGCVVILKRGAPPSGHVGFFAGYLGADTVKILGGNQSDSVKISNYPVVSVIGYRAVKEK